MKKLILTLKIFITNLSRIITSFLFININFSFLNKVFATNTFKDLINTAPTCYATAPRTDTVDSSIYIYKNVFILFVPIVIIIGIVIFIVRKNKKKHESNLQEENKSDKEN